MALSPLLRQPLAVLGLVAALIAATLAARSVAYPLALRLLAAPVFAIIGSDPLPGGSVVIITAAFTALGVVLWLARPHVVSRGKLLTAAWSGVPVLLSLILVGVMVSQLGASASSHYGGRKLELFIVGPIVGLIAGVIVGRDREDFDLYVGLTLLLSTFAAAVLFVQLAGGQAAAVYTGRFSIAGSDPITLGRMAGVGLLLGMYLLTSSKLLWLRICALGSLPLLAVGIVASGGRGPVVGVVLGLIVLLTLLGQDQESRRRIPLILVGGLLAAVLVSQVVPGQAVNRALSVLTGTGAGVSSNGRSALWHQAFQAFGAHPFTGVGTGGFAAINPENMYPHNMLLEVASELGLAGLVPMLGIILTGAATLLGNWRRANVRGHDRARPALVAALFVAALANAMFSGDLSLNGDVWLALGLGVGMTQLSSRSGPESRAEPAVERVWSRPLTASQRYAE